MITAVIPTRNRPRDLANAIKSIVSQTRLPDQLIIVDQSASYESFRVVDEIASEMQKLDLVYVHNPEIKGLVEAKQVAVEHASSEIICFLEDDVILEPDYIDQIELGFLNHTEMVGCSGIITNPPGSRLAYKWLYRIFHRGIFGDDRPNIFGHFEGRGHPLIPSDKLSGGVSAWRRHVFDIVAFDALNGFHMFEDIDFSTRVHQHFGNVLYINPNARLEHLSSPVNRDTLGATQKRKVTEYVTYYKKRRRGMFVGFSFYWLLFGMFLQSVFTSITVRSTSPLCGFFTGLYDGFTKKVVLSNERGQKLV